MSSCELNLDMQPLLGEALSQPVAQLAGCFTARAQPVADVSQFVCCVGYAQRDRPSSTCFILYILSIPIAANLPIYKSRVRFHWLGHWAVVGQVFQLSFSFWFSLPIFLALVRKWHKTNPSTPVTCLFSLCHCIQFLMSFWFYMAHWHLMLKNSQLILNSWQFNFFLRFFLALGCT